MSSTFKSCDYEYKRVSIGSVVGRLTVECVAGRSKNGSKIWHCICECGNTKDVISSSLNSGLVQSCGCRYDEIKGKQTIIHGMTGSKTYNSWLAMKQRCSDPNADFYCDYGGRGITVCERWATSFEDFYADMGERPKGYSIDRVDVNGDYEPSNCKWSTGSNQSFNTRMSKRNTSGKTGVLFDKQTGKWVASITCNNIVHHLGSFALKSDAIHTRVEAETKYFGYTKE